MKPLGLLATAVLLSTGLFAQNRGGFVNTGGITRTGGSVVFPAGTSAAPGVQRTAGSVVYPGGGGPQIGIPSAVTNLNFPAHAVNGGRQGNRGVGHSQTVVYGYPVYVGGGYADPYAGQQAPPPGQAPQQPNVVVVYGPQQPPVVINQYPSSEGQYVTAVQPQTVYPQQSMRQQQVEESASTPEATHYLIAFQDHSIYSAVAYWVQGDTLHYFTNGNTHNQASISLIDRELTARLNRESGVEVKLPPVSK